MTNDHSACCGETFAIYIYIYIFFSFEYCLVFRKDASVDNQCLGYQWLLKTTPKQSGLR